MQKTQPVESLLGKMHFLAEHSYAVIRQMLATWKRPRDEKTVRRSLQGMRNMLSRFHDEILQAKELVAQCAHLTDGSDRSLNSWSAELLRDLEELDDLTYCAVLDSHGLTDDQLRRADALVRRITDRNVALQVLAARGTTKRRWRAVQDELVAMCKGGGRYTSVGDLAKLCRCSKSTVQKAITLEDVKLDRDRPQDRRAAENARLLQHWQSSANKSAAPRAVASDKITLETRPQTRERHPSDLLRDEDVDTVLSRLTAETSDDERARIEELTPEERREMAQAIHDQNLDDEPSPLDQDPSRRVKLHKRV